MLDGLALEGLVGDAHGAVYVLDLVLHSIERAARAPDEGAYVVWKLTPEQHIALGSAMSTAFNAARKLHDDFHASLIT